MRAEQRYAFFSRLASVNPEPVSELEYASPFELLVAVILSAQATDVSVNKAMRMLFPVANTPQAMIALGAEGLEPWIKTIGLYRTKAKNVVAMSGALLDRHEGEVPNDRTALEALAGVGPKTAGVILNNVFGAHAIAVDTHVFRVSNRTGLARAKTVGKVEALLMKRVPKEFLRGAHHWLILHGRYVCKARTPECWRCVVSDLCAYKPKRLAPMKAKPQ